MDFINTSFNNILSLSSSFSTSLVSIFNSSFNSSQTLQKNKCPHIKSGISNCYRCNGKNMCYNETHVGYHGRIIECFDCDGHRVCKGIIKNEQGVFIRKHEKIWKKKKYVSRLLWYINVFI